MARLVSITYAGVTVGLGGGASYVLTDKYRVASSYTEFSITFDVIVRNSGRSAFLAAEAALIAAFRKPDQDLTVELGGSGRHTFSHADGSGFNARATCEKIGGLEDTANSARYRCSVTVQLPADLAGRDGRQTAAVSVDVLPNGERSVTITGTYTVLEGGTTALAQYQSAADTYCQSILADIDADAEWEPMTPGDGAFNFDDQNKVLSFRRTYTEVIYRQALGARDHAAIKRPVLSVERITPTDDSDPFFDVRPLEQIRVTYSAMIDKNESQDLRGLYESVIRPLMMAEARALAQSTLTVTREVMNPAPTGNSISAIIEAAADTGAAFYRVQMDVTDEVVEPVDWAPVWDGDPYSVDEYVVPALHVKAITRQTAGHADRPFPVNLGIPSLPGFKLWRQMRRESLTSIGAGGDWIPIRNVIHTFVYRKVNVAPRGGPTGSGADGNAGGGLRSQVRQDPMGYMGGR